MRLTPIASPRSLIMKIAYFVSKRMFGKVLSAFQVIYARSTPIFMVANKIMSTQKKLTLDQHTKLLIGNFVSHLNDCPFCSNINEYLARKDDIEWKKIMELMNFRNCDLFSAKEKAILSYLEEVTLTRTATDECFNELKKYYTDKEIVEITWLNAVENYFNLQAKPLGLTSDGLK
jgi:alkylhydroperoxidase family enzyme